MSFTLFLKRSLHRSMLLMLRHREKRANPGVAFQLNEMKFVEEDFANSESDLMDVHKSHKQHEMEMEQQREKTRLRTVRQKHFKERHPNFLTYAEKEQMRFLHAKDAKEWSADKLAECFPSSSEVVVKVLRAKWTPSSLERVRQHDEAVMKNWEKFRNGQYANMPPALKEHLTNFTKRSHNLGIEIESNDKWKPRSDLPKPKSREFISIVAGDKEQREQQPLLPAEINTRNAKSDAEESYLLGKIKDKRPMRYKDLHMLKLESKSLSPTSIFSTKSLEPCSAMIANNSNIADGLSQHTNHTLIEQFQNEIVINQEDQKRYEMSTIKDRIYVPKKLRREGAIYKVEDCYYDDDGEFLYRVPGMTDA